MKYTIFLTAPQITRIKLLSRNHALYRPSRHPRLRRRCIYLNLSFFGCQGEIKKAHATSCKTLTMLFTSLFRFFLKCKQRLYYALVMLFFLYFYAIFAIVFVFVFFFVNFLIFFSRKIYKNCLVLL